MTAPTKSPKGKGRKSEKGQGRETKRLRPGELDGLVLHYIAQHQDNGPLTSSAIGKGIGRSSGAVGNCLVRLAKKKKVRQAKKTPRAYVLAREAKER